MEKILKIDDLNDYVSKNVVDFHDRRLKKIKSLSLNGILSKKNPYLFRAKNINLAADLIENIMQAFLSSSE